MTKSNEFTISGLTTDVQYVFAVKAINKVGVSEQSPVSESQSATERKEEPVFDIDIEMRKTLIVKHGNSFTLTALFKGKPVPSVTWNKEEVDLKARASIETTETCTSVTIEKATRNDSGQYIVTLDNGVGTASLPVMVKVLDTPGPPTNVKITEVTKDSATVTWEPPENDGGDAVKAYHVEKREASKKAWVCVTSNCHSLTYRVEDLQEGAIYYFRITGENEFGTGVTAETKDGTKITEKTSSPARLGVTAVTKNSVTIAWSKPEYDGGSRITSYLIDALDKGQQKWVKCATVKANTHIIKNLRENAEYFFRVRAENHAGLSEPKEMIIPVVVKDQLDAPEFDMKNFPHNTVYVRAGSNLKFELPLSGKPMPKVTMSRGNAPVKSGKRFSFEVTPERLNINLKESTASDAGRYDIVASNTSGTTKMFVNILVLDRPGPPVGPVEVSDVRETSLCLKWLPPVYDGGSPVTNYVVLKRETSTPAWTEVSSTIARSTVKVTKLTKGEQYQFRVKAENRFGISDHIDSQSVTVKLPYTIPGPPSTPWLGYVSRESLTVCWNEPVVDGGSPVVGYHVQMKERSSILWQTVNKTAIPATQIRVTNICPGMIYEFKVAVENAAGIGKFSKTSEEVLAIDACEPPTNVRISEVTKNSISLVWQKPPFDGGSKITGYMVERRDAPNGRWTKANFTNVIDTNFIVSGLTQDQAYEFRIFAKNAVGSISNPSLIAGPVTCVDISGAPVIDLPPEYLDVVQYKAGTSFKIKVGIFAKPLPTIEWLKDEKELVSSAQLSIENTTDSSAILIKDASRLNTGTYELKIKNVFGTASASIRIQTHPLWLRDYKKMLNTILR
ncbi:titin-like [Sinocyclocheilus grahami]|uniref:titin-like n=1 Tax=Sinocyclocheilus grahami TaxID=75366 RepID=UPI0007ACD1ED|nr:PREDICTED: titin-like [Sinocyclocheilus grahami]